MANWQTYADDAQLIRSSGFFLRLAGKTQIFTPRGNPHTRMRMSHTMDVLAFAQRVISGLGEDTLHTLDAGLDAWSVHENPKEHLWLVTAIALAHEIGAEVVLLDERDARRAAKQLGLRVLGTIGILMWGRRVGRLASLREALDALRAQARFRISRTLYEEALEEVGEQDR